MSNIIDKIQVSGVTYDLPSGGGDSVVSAFTDFKVAIPSECNYDTVTTFYIKCTAPSNQTGSGFAIMFYLYNGNPFSTVDKIISANFQDGVYVSVTSSDVSYTATIEDGVIKVVLAEGYSLKNIYFYNQCVCYTIYEYSSGYTSDVMVDTVYDALGKLSDDTIRPKLVDASLSLSSGNLVLSKTKTNGDNNGASITVESNTINTDGGRLNVHFSGTTLGEKVLNTGNGNYCDVINTWEYEKAYDDVTITINSGYTGSDTYFYFWTELITTNGSSVQYTLTYDKTNNSLSIPEDFLSYATVQDTLSTDYKFKIITNSGYRVRYLYQTTCSIGGVENNHPNDYITNLVTTSSYDLNGQDIIDDIYSKISGGSGYVATSAVTSAVTSGSTDSEIPTAKAVYDAIPQGGGNPTVELTQAEYDALVSAGTVANDTYYIITDAPAVDISNYYTSAQTNAAINAAVSGKVDTSAVVSAVTSASTDSEIPTAKAVWEAASGGGTTYTAGRGIDITNDTISFSLPISAGTGNNSVRENGWNSNTVASGNYSHAEGYGSSAKGNGSHAEGYNTEADGNASHTEGQGTKSSNLCEHASGQYNVSNKANTTFGDSGNTLFSVGNGTANNARHNAFEIRQNGDMYLNNGTSDIKLQDYLQIKVVKLTQSAYDALSPNYDSNTLYVIVN